MTPEEPPVAAREANIADSDPGGYPKIAWVVIIGFIIFSIYAQRQADPVTDTSAQEAVQSRTLEIQGKYLVAASRVPGIQASDLYLNLEPLDTGPLSTRLRLVVLAGELIGPDEALKRLDAVEASLDDREQLADPQSRTISLLREIYTQYSNQEWGPSSVGENDAAFLQKELGWFGALALTPNRQVSRPVDAAERDTAADAAPVAPTDARKKLLSEAWSTFLTVIFSLLMLLGLGGAGCIGAVAFAYLTFSGQLRSAMQAVPQRSAVYAETFAIWMLTFTAISLAAAFLVRRLEHSQLLVSSVGSMLSLVGVAWPLLRGVSWRQTCEDLGLLTERKALREILWGVVCYVSNLPVILLGLLIMLVLLALYNAFWSGTGMEQAQPPAHPIINWVREANWLSRLHICLLACVIAPIVEETVFRGVLYRHLRNCTAKWRTGVSVFSSTLVNSLIFAVIHPQGLLAAPALMGVAVGLSLVREWRGSLVAPITMHAANNGILMLLLFSLL
jgi:membrane protease YdiL (CAAX protease family)